MAKKRKTREQKIIADLRRKLGSQPVTSISPKVPSTPSYTLSEFKPTSQPLSPNYLPAGRQGQLRITNYPYVLSDLRKTAILTVIALSIQIGLYFVLIK